MLELLEGFLVDRAYVLQMDFSSKSAMYLQGGLLDLKIFPRPRFLQIHY